MASDQHAGRPWWLSSAAVWGFFFAYAALAAVLVQLVLLPHFFPAWNGGDGMLVGNDSVAFNRMAARVAQQIRLEGWSAWQLRPKDEGTVGIASAVYALTWPHPWAMIPILAALHATSVLVLLKLVELLVPQRRTAIWAVMPFALYPSAMIWYTQLLKDNYTVPGTLMFIYGLALIARPLSARRGRRMLLIAAVWMVAGAGLVWLMRPYLVQMMEWVGAAIGLVLVATFVIRAIKGQQTFLQTIFGSILIVIVLVAMAPMAKTWVIQALPTNPSSGPSQPTSLDWRASRWLPPILESKFYSLASSRYDFTQGFLSAASNIDLEVSFHSASEVIAYIPRAAEIAFLAPFPSQWLGQGSLAPNTFMRRAAGIEMTGIYLALAALPLALWHWRNRLELWIIVSFSVAIMMIYALAVANLGTLYRMRFPFMMALVAIGIAGAISLWEEHSLSMRVRTESARNRLR